MVTNKQTNTSSLCWWNGWLDKRKNRKGPLYVWMFIDGYLHKCILIWITIKKLFSLCYLLITLTKYRRIISSQIHLLSMITLFETFHLCNMQWHYSWILRDVWQIHTSARIRVMTKRYDTLQWEESNGTVPHYHHYNIFLLVLHKLAVVLVIWSQLASIVECNCFISVQTSKQKVKGKFLYSAVSNP